MAFPADGENRQRPSQNLAKSSLVFSVCVHLFFVVSIVALGYFSTHRRKDEKPVDWIEFTVAVPPQPEVEETPEPEPQAKQPEPEPEPEPPPPPKQKDPDALPPEKPPKPKFEKGKIVHREAPKPERKIVEKPKKETPKKVTPLPRQRVEVKGPKLSDDEIRKLLDKGARPSDHTSIPDSENARCNALIANAIKRAWICPDASAITGRDPKIEFSLGFGGSIGNVRLVSSSGNAELDQSVLNAAKAVHSIPGLTADFIRANPRVTMTFTLEDA